MNLVVDSSDPDWRARREDEWELVLNYNFWPKVPLKRDRIGMNDRKMFFMGDSVPEFKGLSYSDARDMFHYSRYSPHQSVENYREWIRLFNRTVTDGERNMYYRSVFSVIASSGFRVEGTEHTWELKLFENALQLNDPGSVFYDVAKGMKVYPENAVSRCSEEIAGLMKGERIASKFPIAWINHLVENLWAVDEYLFEMDLSKIGAQNVYGRRLYDIKIKSEDNVVGFYEVARPRISLMYLLHYLHHSCHGYKKCLEDPDNKMLPVYREGNVNNVCETRKMDELRKIFINKFKSGVVPDTVVDMSAWISHSPLCISYISNIGRDENYPFRTPEEAVEVVKAEFDAHN